MGFLMGLDRDGTIIDDADYLGKDENWREQVRVLPGAIEGLGKLIEKGNKLFVASNQAGVARGFFDINRMNEVNRYVANLFRDMGVNIEKWYLCPYVGGEYAKKNGIPLDNLWIRETEGRKPGIGMVIEAAYDLGVSPEKTKFYFIGDKKVDVQTGLNAGGKGILVLSGHGREDEMCVREMEEFRKGEAYIAENFLEAVKIVLDRK